MTRTVTLAHSPDADDAFMFYALAKDKIDTKGLKFEHELNDIETLNRRAADGVYDVTAISFAAYPSVRDKYRMLNCGASVGDNYGPIVVSKRSLTRYELDDVTVAVPGEWTTAFLALRLFSKTTQYKVVPFDKIFDAVEAGDVDAGLVIHEGQLTYSDRKLHRIVDLGEWWKMGTGLPLPLGGNAIKRSIDDDTTKTIAAVMRDAFKYSLDNRSDALDYALSFGRGVARDRADKFVGMYVNDFTVDLGDEGRKSVVTLLRYGFDAGLIKEQIVPDFIG